MPTSVQHLTHGLVIWHLKSLVQTQVMSGLSLWRMKSIPSSLGLQHGARYK